MLAADDTPHTRNAVKYLFSMSSVIKELNITLINIQPAISQFLEDEAKTKIASKKALDEVKKRNAPLCGRDSVQNQERYG